VSRVNKKHFEGGNIQKIQRAKVSLTRNFRTIWGLYNGALGTVKDIVYYDTSNCSPNQGDFSLYVIVQFDNDEGPQGKEQLTKTEIPIPICSDLQNELCAIKILPDFYIRLNGRKQDMTKKSRQLFSHLEIHHLRASTQKPYKQV
jgi:hypothetical protein